MKRENMFRIILTLLILVTTSAYGQDITLSWDASPTPEVAGYKVYYQQNSPDFPFNGVGAIQGSSPVDVGNVLTTQLTGLVDGDAYFFTVTAYDAATAESTYSNIVSNLEPIELLTPANGATGEPVPATFQWSFPATTATLNYTLYYGTDPTLAVAAVSGNDWRFLSKSGPTAIAFLATGLMAMLTLLLVRKRQLTGYVTGVFAFSLFLTACGGGGGGDTTTSTRTSADDTTTTEAALTVFSIDKGASDYHQAFDLENGTRYYWKVVGTDINDPSKSYTSVTYNFTTESF